MHDRCGKLGESTRAYTVDDYVAIVCDMVEIIYLSQLVPFGTTVDAQVCILIDCSTRSNPSWLGLGICNTPVSAMPCYFHAMLQIIINAMML